MASDCRSVRLIDRLGDEIDLLLSDVVMPGMSGPDLLDRARRTRPELRAIFMSGYSALTIGRPVQTGVTLLEKPCSGAGSARPFAKRPPEEIGSRRPGDGRDGASWPSRLETPDPRVDSRISGDTAFVRGV